MDTQSQLGGFLLARRSQLRPPDVGLPDDGERRRVSGLRREELAMIAGVSVSYYTRLEQGVCSHASFEVLEALAGALRLDSHERLHLHELAGASGRRPPRRRDPVERATAGELELMAAMTEIPVLVTGRRGDVLAWNAMGHALLAGHFDATSPDHPADRPNTARLVFLDAHSRDLYVDWPAKARAVVANLRLLVGRYPEDPQLASLIGELTMASADFAAMWPKHRVRACTLATWELRHPLVGSLTVAQQVLDVAQEEGRSFVTFTTEPGSASEAALAMLRQATATRTCSRPLMLGADADSVDQQRDVRRL